MEGDLSIGSVSYYSEIDLVVENLYWERERDYLNASLALIGGYITPRMVFVGGTNAIGQVERYWPILTVYFPQMELRLSRIPLSETSMFSKVFNRSLALTPANPNPVGQRLEVEDPELLPTLPGYYAKNKIFFPFGEFYYYLYDQVSREVLYISEKLDKPPFVAIYYRHKVGFEGPIKHVSIFSSRVMDIR